MPEGPLFYFLFLFSFWVFFSSVFFFVFFETPRLRSPKHKNTTHFLISLVVLLHQVMKKYYLDGVTTSATSWTLPDFRAADGRLRQEMRLRELVLTVAGSADQLVKFQFSILPRPRPRHPTAPLHTRSSQPPNSTTSQAEALRSATNKRNIRGACFCGALSRIPAECFRMEQEA